MPLPVRKLPTILHGDCVNLMAKMPMGSFELLFADPPFNIGYQYDVYSDNKSYQEYMDWSRSWITEGLRCLTAIGDAFVSDLDVLCRRGLGLTRRSWVVWHYTFGVNSLKKFTPSHTHLLHYVKNPKVFTFNAQAVKVPSARELVYKDKRAKEGGRLPDDVWVLRPQDANGDGFVQGTDTWYTPRLCGTHKERVDHPCQMPLAVMERILAVSSNRGDRVLDPFAGSGSTLVAAHKLGRRATGIELSEEYVKVIKERLKSPAL